MDDEYILVDDESLAQLRAHSQWAERQRAHTEEELQEARCRLEEAAQAVRCLAGSPQRTQADLQAERIRFQERLARLEESLAREVEEQNARLRRELDELQARQLRADAAADDAARRVQEVTERFEAEFRAAARRTRDQRERARLYCAQLSALLGEIAPLHPEKLTPGRAEPLGDSLRLAESDLDSGDCQAASAVAQTALPEAAALLGELKRLNGEYDRLSAQVRAALNEVRQAIQNLQDRTANAKTVQAAEGSGLYQFDGDVGFWAGGLLDRLCGAFGEEVRRAQDDLDAMALDRLERAAEQLPLYLGRFQRCREFADGEFLLSCAVQELALSIYDALTEDGSWELTRSGFQDEDPRQSYTESFRDSQGNAVTVVIQPGRTAGGGPSFSLDACGGEENGLRAVLREAALARLAARGIDVSACGEPARGRDASAFIRETCAQGNRIREKRVRDGWGRISL